MVGIHEVGHLFGCKHQNDNRVAANLKSYARAWVNPNNQNDRTIMFSNFPFTFRFSNPNLGFGASDRNNARRIREISHVISNYRQGQDPLQIWISGPSVIDNSHITYT